MNANGCAGLLGVIFILVGLFMIPIMTTADFKLAIGLIILGGACVYGAFANNK